MPAKKRVPPQNQKDEFAPTTWGQTSQTLECPSGQKCLAKRIEIPKLIESGTLNNLDMLTSIVDQKHVSRKAKGGKNSAKSEQMTQDMQLRAILKDPQKMADAFKVIDEIVIAAVVAPPLLSAPENDIDRITGEVYIDTVDLDDKIYIMNWALGGSKDLARFRRELKKSIDDLADGEDVSTEAE